jgi:GNAT superfamily N-acetyltransferase
MDTKDFPDWRAPHTLRDFPPSRHRGLQKCLLRDYGDKIELVSLVVKENWRDKGVGSRIVKKIQELQKPIFLHLRSDGPPGDRFENIGRLIHFYQNLGFEFLGQSNYQMVWVPRF